MGRAVASSPPATSRVRPTSVGGWSRSSSPRPSSPTRHGPPPGWTVRSPGKQLEPSPDAVARLVEEATGSVRVSTREVRSVLRPQPRPVPPSGVPPRPTRPRLGRGVGTNCRSAARRRRRHGVDRGGGLDRPGSRREGGLLGDIHLGELSGPLEDALFAAEVGAVVGPIWTEHGWHVAQVERATPASCVPFATVRSSIEADLLTTKRTTAFATWLDARRSALAVIEPGYEHPAQPGHGFQSHRH